MDKLEEIFQHQLQLDEHIAFKRGLVYPWHLLEDDEIDEEEVEELRVSWIKETFDAFEVEKAEVYDAMQYKWWKNHADEIDWDEVKDELIDCLHFFVSILIKAGMAPDEIYERYMNKNKENHDRQQGTVAGREDYGQ